MGIEDNNRSTDELKAQVAVWTTLRTRGEIKRAGKELDRNASMKEALVSYLAGEGWAVSSAEAGKKLIRRLLDRETNAQVRKNPIHLNESFLCIFCGQQIDLPKEGIRDHCPLCLRGRHVDIVPGDRAADCRGCLQPTRFELVGGTVWIEYTCTTCPHIYRVRAHPEDQIPHSLSVVDLPKSV